MVWGHDLSFPAEGPCIISTPFLVFIASRNSQKSFAEHRLELSSREGRLLQSRIYRDPQQLIFLNHQHCFFLVNGGL